ncbi:MAG: ribonuclease P protein component 4 [Candidatus Woesearchaeota archaeon]
MVRPPVDKKVREAKAVVAQRIEFLIEKAAEVASKELCLANRYVTLARTLSMKFNVKIPSRLQRRFCKHCYTFLVPGLNCRVRTREGKVVYTCESCKKYMRIPFTREKKNARQCLS